MSPHLLECVHSLQSHAHRPTDSKLAKATCCHPHFVMSAKLNSHEAARIHNESINQTIGQHMKRLAPAPWSINRQRSDPPPHRTPRAAARLRTHDMKPRLHGGQRPQIAVLSRPRRHAAHNRNLRCAVALLGGAPLVPSPAVLPSRHYAAAAATGAPESAPRPPGQPTSAIHRHHPAHAAARLEHLIEGGRGNQLRQAVGRLSRDRETGAGGTREALDGLDGHRLAGLLGGGLDLQ